MQRVSKKVGLSGQQLQKNALTLAMGMMIGGAFLHPVHAQETLELGEVLGTVSSSRPLMSELNQVLSGQGATLPDVVCSGQKLQSEWENLADQAIPPFDCQVGNQRISITATVTVYGIDGSDITSLPTLKQDGVLIGVSDINWQWQSNQGTFAGTGIGGGVDSGGSSGGGSSSGGQVGVLPPAPSSSGGSSSGGSSGGGQIAGLPSAPSGGSNGGALPPPPPPPKPTAGGSIGAGTGVGGQPKFGCGPGQIPPRNVRCDRSRVPDQNRGQNSDTPRFAGYRGDLLTSDSNPSGPVRYDRRWGPISAPSDAVWYTKINRRRDGSNEALLVFGPRDKNSTGFYAKCNLRSQKVTVLFTGFDAEFRNFPMTVSTGNSEPLEDRPFLINVYDAKSASIDNGRKTVPSVEMSINDPIWRGIAGQNFIRMIMGRTQTLGIKLKDSAKPTRQFVSDCSGRPLELSPREKALRAAASANPSCDNPRTDDQIAICSDLGLLNNQRQLDQLYRTATSKSNGRSKRRISNDQRNWKQKRKGCKGQVGCLFDVFTDRLQELADELN